MTIRRFVTARAHHHAANHSARVMRHPAPLFLAEGRNMHITHIKTTAMITAAAVAMTGSNAACPMQQLVSTPQLKQSTRACSTSNRTSNADTNASSSSSSSQSTNQKKPKRKVLRRVLTGVGLFAAVCGLTMLPSRDRLGGALLHFRLLLEGIGRVLRCAELGLRVLLDYKLHLTESSDQAAWDEVHYRAAHALVALAERNGGLYIKLGQSFCSMNHLLPPPFWRTMAVLQNAVVSRPFPEVRAVLEAEYGRPVAEVFATFDETPIAAASMAQVHRATLKDTDGQEVAVKVQYIDIGARFRGDMATIGLMLKLCGFFFPGYDFSTVTKRTEKTLEAELDFVQESRNAEECAQDIFPLFQHEVVTPTVHWDLTTPRVMVTTFIKGVKVSDAEGLKKLGITKQWAMDRYISVFAHQLFTTGFVHADPHPGNVLVHRDPLTNKPQMVVLDHGLYVRLPEATRRTFARLWSASVTRHDDEVEAASLEMGIKNYQLLASMFLQFPYRQFSPFKMYATANDLSKMQEQASAKMHEVTEILDNLPNEYALVLRNLSTVRATNKELGNPVCRTALLYRYSVRTAGLPWYTMWARVWSLQAQERMADLSMLFLRWWRPELFVAIDEMLKLG